MHSETILSDCVPFFFSPRPERSTGPLTILHLCMKYESCTLKTTQVTCILVLNYSSSLVRTKVLTKFLCDLDLLTQKCIGIFLSPLPTSVFEI